MVYTITIVIMRKYILPFFLLFLLYMPISAATISGSVELENKADPTGMVVDFTAVSPSAVTSSAAVLQDGSYTAIIPNGVYNVQWHKDGYKSHELLNIFFFNDTTLPGLHFEYIKNAIILQGKLTGTLYNDSFYLVDAYSFVDYGDTLFIEPGTELRFGENVRFKIIGSLVAIGTEEKPITFTLRTFNTIWSGFYIDSQDSSVIFRHCIFEKCYEAMRIDQVGLLDVENCEFRDVSYGVRLWYGRMRVKNNVFLGEGYETKGISAIENNYGRAFIENNHIMGYSSGISNSYPDVGDTTLIRYNRIEDCVTGISKGSYYAAGHIVISYNTLNNCDFGIAFKNGNGSSSGIETDSVYNNTIYQCTNTGLYIENPKGYFSMNLVAECKTGVYFAENALVTYNLFHRNGHDVEYSPKGLGVIIGQNKDSVDYDTYLNLFTRESQFQIKNRNHPHFLYLSAKSDCIDAGDPNYKDADGSIRDIGAHPYVAWVGEKKITQTPGDFNLFPNPNNGHFSVTFINLTSGQLQIMDISGRMLVQKTFTSTNQLVVSENLNPGMYVLIMKNGKDLIQQRFVVQK